MQSGRTPRGGWKRAENSRQLLSGMKGESGKKRGGKRSFYFERAYIRPRLRILERKRKHSLPFFRFTVFCKICASLYFARERKTSRMHYASLLLLVQKWNYLINQTQIHLPWSQSFTRSFWEFFSRSVFIFKMKCENELYRDIASLLSVIIKKSCRFSKI